MSAVKLKPFEYFEPDSVNKAVDLLLNHQGQAQVLAGGVDLIPQLRFGSIEAKYLVNIQRIPSLDYMKSSKDGHLEFGAMATLHSIELWQELKVNFHALWNTIHQITSVQTKCMGTLVGNLCVATPASDVSPALAVLDAELLIAGPNGERAIPVSDFFQGYRKTALEIGEMVTGVKIPPLAANSGDAFFNLVRTHADIAKVTASAVMTLEGDRCLKARIAVGSAAPTMYRAIEAELILEGQVPEKDLMDKAAKMAANEARPIDDLRSTADYRKEMVRVLVERALHKALDKARAKSQKEVAS